MAIVNKDKYLKDIASCIKRGEMYFEAADRPVVEMGGRKVYVSSVSMDLDLGVLAYQVSNARGEVIPSAHGVRPLSELDGRVLSSVNKVVRQYHGYELQRERNLRQVSSRVNSVRRKVGPGL